MYYVFAKGYDRHACDYTEVHFGTRKQRQRQRNFVRTFTARVQSFAKSGMNVAMNRKKNFCHIVGAAIIDVIISKSQANKNIF